MKRRRISTRERADIFFRNGGHCALCGGSILPADGWDVHHATPLELGGEDEGENLVPVHRTCHRTQTASEDVPRIRKAQRQQAKHLGFRAPSRTPLPFSKRSPLRKKINGTVVRRHDP